MKKQFYLFSTLIAGLLTVTSCNNEQLENSIAESESLTPITSVASMPQGADTKITLDTSSEKIGLTWEESGESFYVFKNSETTPKPFEQTGSNENENQKAHFTGSLSLDKTSTYYAIYNSGLTSEPTSEITLDMAGQAGSEPVKDYIYLRAETQYDGSGTMNFPFKHLTSVLRVNLGFEELELNVTGTFSSTRVSADATISNVRITGKGLKSQQTINIATGEEVSSTEGAIELSGTFKPTDDVYIHFIPGTIAGLTISADVDGKPYMAALTVTANPLDAGYMYTTEAKLGETYEMNFSGKTSYNGLTMQIGTWESEESDVQKTLATTTIANGKALFPVNSVTEGKSWFCIPKVVKFFHTLTTDEVEAGKLTLPDKDNGSTLNAKTMVNDWIVALYMGVNKDGNTDANATPIYWATGNLIAVKMNEANSGQTEATFFIGIEGNTADEGDDRFFILENTTDSDTDGYSTCEKGTMWDLFGWGDASGLITTEDITKYAPEIGNNESICGNAKYDIARAQLGRSWRLPAGGDENTLHEFVVFTDNEYPDLLPNGVVSKDTHYGYCNYTYTIDNMRSEGNTITNTLCFPFTGSHYYDLGTMVLNQRGQYAWYWSGLSYEDTYISNSAWFFYIAQNAGFNWDNAGMRSEGCPVRPVTE